MRVTYAQSPRRFKSASYEDVVKVGSREKAPFPGVAIPFPTERASRIPLLARSIFSLPACQLLERGVSTSSTLALSGLEQADEGRLRSAWQGVRSLRTRLPVDAKTTFNKVIRSVGTQNQAADAWVRNILNNGVRTIVTPPTLGRQVIQFQIPGSFGARWELSGKFHGFINP